MKLINKVLCCGALSFSMLFVGIGYATITDELEINGLVSAQIPNKVFLTSAIPETLNNAVVNSSSFTSTILNTSLIFDASSGSSEAGYKLTFYNGSNLIYEYDDEIVQTYSNNNVTYTVTNLLSGQLVQPKSYVTAYIFFDSNVTTTLNSIINFNFVVSNTDENIGLSNHESLIDAMLNDPTNGLNTSNSYLNRQIASRNKGSLFTPSRDTLGSMAVTQGNTLEDMFGDSYATNEKIAFLLHFFDTNNDDVMDYYYLYTTSVALGPNGSPSIAIEQPIYQVYRTKIVYDNEEGEWVAEEIKEGYANSAYYEESQPNWNINRTKIPSFEPDSWTEGKLGTAFSNAIWTSVNQTSYICIETSNNVEKKYFRINIPANTSYSVMISEDNETTAQKVLLETYNSNQTLLSSSYASITFPTSSSATTYYFSMSGSRNMDFKLVKN